ncbi:MAG: bifunctional riboflavin kinase/FAD synthetase [Pseudanabaenaceae cyanobacterium bins.68]|nr:bifunctional riboflavin kinase/FAD synthetase [Pseudanabaenaceae cyanobacterium bins.68]
MQIFSSPHLDQIQTPTAIALGNFDGLHLGHQAVIQALKSVPAASTLVSFRPHPREFFTGQSRSLLTPLVEKVDLLTDLGIAQLVLLEFNQDLANLTAAGFITQILQTQLQAAYISVGFNFQFGAQRLGTVRDLAKIWGDRLYVLPEQTMTLGNQTIRICSSQIRTALTEGNVILANQLLGRSYSLRGEVVAGDRLGRELGFPTANLAIDPRKFLPSHGVYVVRLKLGQRWQIGVMNIGVRPTVNGDSRLRVEIHLLNWSGDLYGKHLTVEILDFVRSEAKFNSLADLQAQIQQDCLTASQWL